MSKVDGRIAGVVGDPALFGVAEHNARAEIEELGLSVGLTTRVRWPVDDDHPIAITPSLMPGEAKLFVWTDPPSPAVKSAAKACETMPNIFIVLLINADDYDKRSKVLKDLDKSGYLHVIGFVRPYEKSRWNSMVNMIAKTEKLNLSPSGLSALRQLNHSKVRSVRLKSGRFGDRLTCDLQRVKGDAIKSQMYAGIGQEVSAADVNAICVPSHSVEPWDMIDAMLSGNVAKTIRAFDALVTDQSEARKILGLIRSQIDLIIAVRATMENTTNRDPKDVASAVREINADDLYDVWDGKDKPSSSAPADPFRISKVMELRSKPIWATCHIAMKLCLQAYTDLIGPLATNWNPTMMRLCIDIASISSPSK